MSDQDTDQLSPLKRAIVEIRDLRARVADAEQRASGPIALVGMGLRLPGGAVDPESYWSLLWDGVDAIGEVPPERWPIEALYDPDPDAPGKMATRYGGFLREVEQFDAPFFGISPREAESMDPQQRLLLEVTWEALEHAGIAADRLFGSNAGVFVGLTNSDYSRLLLADQDQIDTYTTTGSTPSVASGRLSYVLGAQGPAVTIDTACSSSLVAVHLAAQSLRTGECDLALAGGVGLVLTPELTINFSRARMMAPDGRCKTFDAAADGYVRSEGCGMVVLKRLSDAVADGDTVFALIRGSAINQDGRSGGLTAPNGPSQEKVITAALANAGLAPHAVSYVEAHGTGTPLGDPIEVHAVGAALCRQRSATTPLLLGSVKTNLGHLEAAAGVASLIKVVLMLQHGAIPPHLHLAELNPHIAAEELPIEVPTERTPWPAQGGGRVAGVSSFGLSGTNAHLIVAEAPAPPPLASAEVDRPVHLLAISAKSPDGLRAVAGRLAGHVATHPEERFADVAFSANTGRTHLGHRMALVAGDSAVAHAQLAAYAAGELAGAIDGQPRAATPHVAFLFTGHGSHYAGMGRELYRTQPVFRAAVDHCDVLLRGVIDRTLPEILFGDEGLLNSMVYAQPALFVVQRALAELWQSWGVHPSVVAGHSAGEYAAAVVAGVLSLDDALGLISARGRLMQSLPPDGEMVALFVEEERVARAIVPYADAVGIAAVNGPATTVISGRRDAVDAVLSDLELDDDELRRLNVSVAAHSPLVEPILAEFESIVAGVTLGPPQIGLVSSMTGSLVSTEVTTADYWRRHLREPVRFAAVFDTMRAAGSTTFVEIGPHPTLLGLGQRCWPDASATWAPSLHRDVDESESMLTSLAALHAAGVSVDWAGFDQPYPRRRLALPTYPWQREAYWSPAAHAQTRGPATPAFPAAATAARLQADQGPLDLRVETHAERWELLDRLAGAYIASALREMGLFTRAGEQHRVEDLIAQGRILPAYDHLVARWLAHLADDGLLLPSGEGGFSAVQSLPQPPLDALLAQAEAAFAGGEEPLLSYVRRCGESLAAVISGEESALTTLFPDGSNETVDHLYSGWAVARYFNAIARAAATAAAQARPGQTWRVLEVGGGTGGTTAALLPALPAERTEYTFTDVSEYFLARAAERFATHPFVRYSLLDIEQPPLAQGYTAQGYDVVVAANVLHATRDLDATLRHARSLLAPGGLLLAYETTNHPRWLDITTGLIEGWQRFEDGWRGDHPLLTAERWSEALTAAGFTEVVALPSPAQPTAVLGQHVLLARAPGEEVAVAPRRERAQPGVGPLPAVAEIIAATVQTADELTVALAEALPDERRELLVDFVRQAMARVLRIADPSRLQRDQPLLDLGFDSLMAVELRNVLRRGLALDRKLPATLVFDHPNIVAIAAYLERMVVGEEPDDSAAPAWAPASTPARDGAEAIAELSDEQVEAMLLQKLAEI